MKINFNREPILFKEKSRVWEIYCFICSFAEFVWFSGFVYYEKRGRKNGIKAHLATNLLSHILPFVEITENNIKKNYFVFQLFLFACFCLTSIQVRVPTFYYYGVFFLLLFFWIYIANSCSLHFRNCCLTALVMLLQFISIFLL